MELEVELTEVEQRPQGQAGAPATREEEATQVRGAARAAGWRPHASRLGSRALACL